MRPSIEYLHECFEYSDGILYWKRRPRYHFKNDRVFKLWNTQNADNKAGSLIKKEKYYNFQIKINKILISRSIIIWAMHNNRWPIKDIDHKDHNSLNDKIDNLREATQSQNSANSKLAINNKSGFKGVSYFKITNKWRAVIRTKHLGYFDTPEEAHEAYMKAAKLYFKEFAYNGVD